MAFTKFTNRTITLAGTSKIVFPDGTIQDTALEEATLTDLSLADGKILVGGSDGDADAVTPSGDAAISNTGVITVTDLTIASEARGDLLRRGASTWDRFSAKTSGQILVGDGTDVVSVAVSGDATLSAAGAVAIGAGKITPAMSSQAEAVTVTADGLTTGIVSVTARHVTVTSDDANKILTLPASVVGKILYIRNGATGYEIRTTAASSIKINDVVSGSTNECAIPATALVKAVCVSATEWVLTAVDKLGAAIAALVPDAV